MSLDFHKRRLKQRLSHVADVLQPVAAVFVWQGEADVPALLPAAADLPESKVHTGQEESQAAQQHREGKDEDQEEGGRQAEAVLGCEEGAVPAEDDGVEGGHE